MEPIEYVRALLRRWPIIAVAALIGAAFAFVGTDPEPEPIETSYSATHTLLVSGAVFAGAQAGVGTITFAQVPVFATTGEIPARVASEIGWQGTPAALAALVTVTGDPETGTILFATEEEDPEEAVRIADAFADETVSYLASRQDELRQDRLTSTLSRVDELEADVADLDEEVAADLAANPDGGADSGLRARRDAAVREYGTAYEAYRQIAAEENASLNVTTLERAQPVQVSTGGFTPPRTRSTRVPIAAGLGALLGAALALVVERLDSRLRDRRRAEEAYGAPVVAELPSMARKQRKAKLVVGPDAHSSVAEAFRSLRTSVTFMAVGGQPTAANDRVGVVLITSPSPSEGKTTIAVNLAAAFAETGRSVVVVNSDFRRPSITSLLLDGERAVLPAGLAGIDRLEAESYIVPTKVPGVALLDLAPLGGSPGDLTRATVRLVKALSATIDVLIIDTPPLVVTTEALEFVPEAKVVVLVGRLGRTSTAGAQRAGELARFGGAEQLAVALNDTGRPALRRTRYYDYYETPQAKSPWRLGRGRKPGAGAATRTDASSATDGTDAVSSTTTGNGDIEVIAVDDGDRVDRVEEAGAEGGSVDDSVGRPNGELNADETAAAHSDDSVATHADDSVDEEAAAPDATPADGTDEEWREIDEMIDRTR